jgi:ribonuclease BN (tRNA processing enzyme)
MRVHFLGCGDAFGSGGRNHSAYLIESPQRLFLLDCGPTTLLAMKRAGFDPCRLDAVILSHLHGDHFGGLPFLFLDYLYEEPRKSPLLIGGPPGTEERVRSLTECMYPGGSGPRQLPPTLFQILEPGRQESIGGIDVFPFRVPHQVQEISLGLKIQVEGKRILYSGDSTWTDLFITHARGVDLFICECTFFDGEDPGHMTYQQIRYKLPHLESKKIVLTHMGREMLAHRNDIPLETAKDGMVVEL